MASGLFRRIDPPSLQAGLPVNRHATWHTWAEPFRLFLRDAGDELMRLAAPPLIRVSGLSDYNRTYSWPMVQWASSRLRQRFLSFAGSLKTVRPRKKIMLFDGLLGPDLDSDRVHALFALLRGALVQLARDERAAVYTPLGQVGKRAGGFPLHADLYIPKILFNVFDAVPRDDSGASLFLPVSMLRELVADLNLPPRTAAGRILAMFDRESTADGFDTLYDLLHGQHTWVPKLERAMEQRQFRITLCAGQGYLLHDRVWLHGREAPSDGVPVNRVHRLVFAPEGYH